jgi:hypothetical protein
MGSRDLEVKMAGRKTREQQLNIIEKRENTKNADDEFDAGADLQRPRASREAFREGRDLKAGNTPPPDSDDRSITRGLNQESRHHKHSESE